MTQTITSPPLVSPTRPEGSPLDNKPAASRASKHEPRTDLKRIGAGLAGLGLLTLAPRQRSAARWACVGLGGALVGGAVIGWPRSNGKSDPQMLRIAEGLQLTTTAEEAYRLWRDFERWPSFMRHLGKVLPAGPDRWTWAATLPGLPPIEWTSELVRDEPARALAWRTLPGSGVDHSGTVTFRSLASGRGTGVRVELTYELPGGAAGRALAALLQPATERLIRADIRRLKSVLEAGEVPVNDLRPDSGEEGRR